MEVRGFVVLGLAVLASVALARQCRKPTSWPGRLTARLMNSSHRGVTTWGLSHLRLESGWTILDVGCGGGATIQRLLARVPRGKIHGIDYAKASAAVAETVNAESIAAGRVEIRVASVSNLPFASDSFDLATAVETHYYWPDLVRDLPEVRRVLKPSGYVALIAETYRGQRFGIAERLAMRLLGGVVLRADEHREVLLRAGYSKVELFEETQKGWLCAVGQKPA